MYRSIMLIVALLTLSFGNTLYVQAQEDAQAVAQKEEQKEGRNDEQTDAQAQAPAEVIPATAHETVEYVSEQLLAMLDGAKERFEADPQKFFADFDAVISPWLDFELWARGVMGKEYVAQASEKQLENFQDVFKKTLVETYAKGLVNVTEASYEVSPPRKGDAEKTTVGVVQTLFSGSDKVQVLYAMRKNTEGRWQFRNVRLEGIDLGRTFRSQFKNAAEENKGDLDKVIAEWGA